MANSRSSEFSRILPRVIRLANLDQNSKQIFYGQVQVIKPTGRLRLSESRRPREHLVYQLTTIKCLVTVRLHKTHHWASPLNFQLFRSRDKANHWSFSARPIIYAYGVCCDGCVRIPRCGYFGPQMLLWHTGSNTYGRRGQTSSTSTYIVNI